MKQLTIAELSQRIEEQGSRIRQLEERQSWLERIFEAYGVRGPWLTPPKAAPLLCISHDRIQDEIELAETLRAAGKQGDLVYGTHYRNIQGVESDRASWQVHVPRFAEFLEIPPDARKAG